MAMNPQLIAHRLSRQLGGRPIGIDDVRLRILAYTSAPGSDDEARRFAILNRAVSPGVRDWVAHHNASERAGVFILKRNPEIGLAHDRWGAVARVDGKAVAYVWALVEEGELDAAEKERLLAAAAELGEYIGRQHLIDELRSLRERDGIIGLLENDPATRAQAAQRLADAELFSDHAPIAAIVLLARGHRGAVPYEAAVRSAISDTIDRHRLMLPQAASLGFRRPGHGLLVVSVPLSGRMLDEFATGMQAELARQLARTHLSSWVGVSSVHSSVIELAEAQREALRAAEVAAAVGALGSTVHFDRMGIYRRIAQLVDDGRAPEAFHPGIRTLLEREEHGDPLAHTLESYLDHAGDVRACSAELHLHRASFYGRLRRIQQITGLDMANGQDRLVAHLEMKLARLGRLREPADSA